jgi:hypothetical protein
LQPPDPATARFGVKRLSNKHPAGSSANLGLRTVGELVVILAVEPNNFINGVARLFEHRQLIIAVTTTEHESGAAAEVVLVAFAASAA